MECNTNFAAPTGVLCNNTSSTGLDCSHIVPGTPTCSDNPDGLSNSSLSLLFSGVGYPSSVFASVTFIFFNDGIFLDGAVASLNGVHTLNVQTFDEDAEIYIWQSSPITVTLNTTEQGGIIRQCLSNTFSAFGSCFGDTEIVRAGKGSDLSGANGASVMFGFEKRRLSHCSQFGSGTFKYRFYMKIGSILALESISCTSNFTKPFLTLGTTPYITTIRIL